MNPLAAIHVAKKQLALDEDTYRAVLVRVTGKASSGAMTEAERQAVLGEMRRLGFRPEVRQGGREGGSKKASNGLQGRFGKQLQAYWIDLWNLGLVKDRRDTALVAFVKRQTGIERPEWVLDHVTAAKAIEAMKGWMSRPVDKGGAAVDWSDGNHLPPYARQTGWRVAWAQWRILAKARHGTAEIPAFRNYCTSISGKVVDTMTPRDWIHVMNALGKEVRSTRS